VSGNQAKGAIALHSPEVRDWLNQAFDQRISGQRSQADTIKLLTTFALAVAATLVATGLQVDRTSLGLNIASVSVLGGATLLTIYIVLCDDIRTPNTSLLRDKLDRPMPIARVVEKLNDLEHAAAQHNKDNLPKLQPSPSYSSCSSRPA
jgi:hypothetical protein